MCYNVKWGWDMLYNLILLYFLGIVNFLVFWNCFIRCKFYKMMGEDVVWMFDGEMIFEGGDVIGVFMFIWRVWVLDGGSFIIFVEMIFFYVVFGFVFCVECFVVF